MAWSSRKSRGTLHIPSPPGISALLGILPLLLVPYRTVSSQDVTTTYPPTALPTSELCSCSPSIFHFSLDFSAVCPPAGINISSTGVSQYFCRVFSAEEESDNLVPDVVTSYAIFELDSTLQVIKQLFREGLNFQDGDVFEYTSIAASGISSPDKIPVAIQMAMVGTNTNGTKIVSQWIVEYTNACNAIPFQEGDFMSWATFEKLVPARPKLCSAAHWAKVPPTETPAVATNPPSMNPMVSTPPSMNPMVPELEPTTKPTKEPYLVVSPTKRPVDDVVPLPAKEPKEDLSLSPSKKPRATMHPNPSPKPTPPRATAENLEPTIPPTKKLIEDVVLEDSLPLETTKPNEESSPSPTARVETPELTVPPTEQPTKKIAFEDYKPLKTTKPKENPTPLPTKKPSNLPDTIAPPHIPPPIVGLETKPDPTSIPLPEPLQTAMSMSQAYDLFWADWDALDPKDFGQIHVEVETEGGRKNSHGRKLFKRRRTLLRG